MDTNARKTSEVFVIVRCQGSIIGLAENTVFLSREAAKVAKIRHDRTIPIVNVDNHYFEVQPLNDAIYRMKDQEWTNGRNS